MKVYLVGGAVRDQLLKLPVKERDWLVVGAKYQQMLDQGFMQVGKDFPVFLHPKTKEEYALARTERKTKKGHHGFEFNISTDITIEQDLSRRDLTINAIAQDQQGQLIDPYGGQKDIKAKQLRHISAAFSEDPLRVFRVARFAARYHHLGFSIADETLQLMRQLSASDELSYLSAERIWKETSRALLEKSPHVYFETLHQCGGLNHWFPELEALWGIPNPVQWHPEIDTGIHTMMVLSQSALLSQEGEIRFAALCHDLGKAITPLEKLPAHPGHEKSGIPLVAQLGQRISAPKNYIELAKLASEFHLHLHRLSQLKASTIVNLLQKTDAFRKPERFKQFITVCTADFRGRSGFEAEPYPQAQQIVEYLHLCQQVTAQEFIHRGLQGAKLGEAIHRQRAQLIKQQHGH